MLLSAQCTDLNVNNVTKNIYPKYNLNVALRGKLNGDYGSDISIYMGSNNHLYLLRCIKSSILLKNYNIFSDANILSSTDVILTN